MKIRFKNVYGDIVELKLKEKNIKYIFKKNVSGDEIIIVVYKDNSVEAYDSDCHFRVVSFNGRLEMIYPEQIDLDVNFIKPNEKPNFKLIKKENK